MAKKRLNRAVLIVHEDTHEVYTSKYILTCTLRTSKCGWLRCCQEIPSALMTQTGQNLTDIDTCENIRLIQFCICHGYYKLFSKGQWITATHHSLLS